MSFGEKSSTNNSSSCVGEVGYWFDSPKFVAFAEEWYWWWIGGEPVVMVLVGGGGVVFVSIGR